jgi:L-fuconate dehydratase
MENRVTEFVDHLHEHLTDPCVVVNGSYTLPGKPGYSAQMHHESVADYSFPAGRYWAGALAEEPAGAERSEIPAGA